MAQRQELTEQEYLDIEAALSANARGRAFLRMRDQRSRVVGVTELRRIMRELKEELGKGEGDTRDAPHMRILRKELQDLSAYIDQTRQEIAALHPADSGANRIMAAAGELDAIVSATERATSEILNGAERIQELVAKLPRSGEIGRIADEVQVQATEVLTACSFQDVTGQRISKVVNTLRYVEQRVNSMIEIWGVDTPAQQRTASNGEDRRAGAAAAPAPPPLPTPPASSGPTQADIDALFESLNTPKDKTKPAAAKSDTPAKPARTQKDIDAIFSARE